MIYYPHEYQVFADQHIIDHPGCGLFMDMGLGKTVVTLTAVEKLIYDYLEIRKVLVIAPKRVAEHTWTTEASKWDHLNHLKISKVLGSEKERLQALRTKADIYVINRENVAWLVTHYGSAFPFDMIVIDELSSFKSAKAVRFKALKMIRPLVKRVVGLTGTPVPNSLIDLWPQLYLLDQGERLGKTVTSYRQTYFTEGRRSGHVVYDYKICKGSEEAIYGRIGDICISMKARDYLTLPDRIDRVVPVKLSDETMKKYLDFEEDCVLALSDVEEITAVNAAALTTKLLQFANGAIYSSQEVTGKDRVWHEVHDEKLEALEEIIEAANGQPVLVAYQYKHDLERIMRRLKTYKPVELRTAADIERWNRGEIGVLVAHPASAGHGLNLQAGGNIIVWFGPIWSLELFLQFNARLDRQGQTKTVIVHHLVATGTMDEDVVKAREDKNFGQEALLQAVKVRTMKYQKLVA